MRKHSTYSKSEVGWCLWVPLRVLVSVCTLAQCNALLALLWLQKVLVHVVLIFLVFLVFVFHVKGLVIQTKQRGMIQRVALFILLKVKNPLAIFFIFLVLILLVFVAFLFLAASLLVGTFAVLCSSSSSSSSSITARGLTLIVTVHQQALCHHLGLFRLFLPPPGLCLLSSNQLLLAICTGSERERGRM